MLYILLYLLIAFSVGILYILCFEWVPEYIEDRKKWNKGVCPVCGRRWKLLYVTPGGYRMYYCNPEYGWGHFRQITIKSFCVDKYGEKTDV